MLTIDKCLPQCFASIRCAEMEKLRVLLLVSAVLSCNAGMQTLNQPTSHADLSLTSSGLNPGQNIQEHLKSFTYLTTVKINASSDTDANRLKNLLQGFTFPFNNKLIRISKINLTSLAPLKSFKYLIDIKINASKKTVIDQLESLLDGYKFPLKVNNRVKVSSVNVTTASLKSFRYRIDMKMNTTNLTAIDRLRGLAHGFQYPYKISSQKQINSLNITTVCITGTSQSACKCEPQYGWSDEQCKKLGACNESSNVPCGCVTSVPHNGQFCERRRGTPKPFKYFIKIKQNTSGEGVSDRLKAFLHGYPFPYTINNQMKISELNVTTAAPLKSFKYLIDMKINASKERVIDQLESFLDGYKFPLKVNKHVKVSIVNIKTVTPKPFKYSIQIKLNTSGEGVIDRLKELLHGYPFPYTINNEMKISKQNFTTAPKPFKYSIQIKLNTSGEGVIDRLKELLHGYPFPYTINNQMKILKLNFTTVSKPFKYSIQVKLNTSGEGVIDQLKALLHGYPFPYTINNQMKISKLNFITAPLKSFRFTMDIKLDTSKLSSIDRLRGLAHGFQYPYKISSQKQINSLNITTVCITSANQSVCKCEPQYGWSDEHCKKLGACNESSNTLCGCVTSVPYEGQFCGRRRVPSQTFKYSIQIKLNTSGEGVIDRLKALLHGFPFPYTINNQMKISGLNITTEPPTLSPPAPTSDEQTSTTETSTAEASTADTSPAEMSTTQTSAETYAIETSPAKASTEPTSTAETSTAETTIADTSTPEISTTQTSAETSPAVTYSTETSPAQTSTEQTTITETSTVDSTTAEIYTTQTSAETHTAETYSAETYTTEKSPAQTSTAQTPTEQTSIAETSTVDSTTAEIYTTQTSAETSHAETSTAETYTTERSPTQTSTAQTPTEQTSTAETSTAETSTVDTAGTTAGTFGTELSTVDSSPAEISTSQTSAETSTAETSTSKTSPAQTFTAETSTANRNTTEMCNAQTSTVEPSTVQATAETSTEQTYTVQTSTEKTSTEQASSAQTSAAEISTAQVSTGKSSAKPSIAQISTLGTSTAQTLTPEMSTPQISTPQTSTALITTLQTSTVEISTAKTSTAQTSTAEMSSTQIITGQTSTAHTSNAETSAVHPSTAQTSNEKTSTVHPSTAQKTTAQTSTVETPTAQTSTAHTSTVETSTARLSTAMTMTAQTSAVADRPSSTSTEFFTTGM
uniref:ADGRF3/5-like N-terminal domain-containing protein n=1 Tax=Astyanax mexicanus TaxID=7994 RepID=A0A8B9JF15_ASTMX